MALVVLAYVLCVCQGARELKKIPKQSEKQGGYPYESVFRRGYGIVAKYCLDIVLLPELAIRSMKRPKTLPEPKFINDV